MICDQNLMANPLISVNDLVVQSDRKGNLDPLLKGVSLVIAEREIVGLAGESGAGKSMLGAAINGLLPDGCVPVSGQILWKGENLLAAPPSRLHGLRGTEIATIFQEPMTALNPTTKVGRQLADVIRTHRLADDAKAYALRHLSDVRIADPQAVFDAWPHQLSGGMRQRVLIAMAFLCRPTLIVADEPTTALDFSIRSQVLDLLLTLAREQGTAVLLISHDIGVMQKSCQRIHVMYAGRVVEQGPTDRVLREPEHPYTRALLNCLPHRARPRSRLEALRPDDRRLPGCAFRARCDWAEERCTVVPSLTAVEGGSHQSACWRVGQHRVTM
jgi:oligopeptide/dipeptide ABC transporter ATP-binding protein